MWHSERYNGHAYPGGVSRKGETMSADAPTMPPAEPTPRERERDTRKPAPRCPPLSRGR